MSFQSTGLSDDDVPSAARRGGHPNPEPLGVPPRQAWAMLGISNSTGYGLIAAGELDSFTVGRARRITTASIHRYMARRIELERLIRERRHQPARNTEART